MQANSAMSLVELGIKQEEEELTVGNEYSTIEKPFFLSPHATN